jgi:hypothetical protein
MLLRKKGQIQCPHCLKFFDKPYTPKKAKVYPLFKGDPLGCSAPPLLNRMDSAAVSVRTHPFLRK